MSTKETLTPEIVGALGDLVRRKHDATPEPADPTERTYLRVRNRLQEELTPLVVKGDDKALVGYLGAFIQLAVQLAYSMSGGNRGRARDTLSGALDMEFDNIEDYRFNEIGADGIDAMLRKAKTILSGFDRMSETERKAASEKFADAVAEIKAKRKAT